MVAIVEVAGVIKVPLDVNPVVRPCDPRFPEATVMPVGNDVVSPTFALLSYRSFPDVPPVMPVVPIARGVDAAEIIPVVPIVIVDPSTLTPPKTDVVEVGNTYAVA